MTVGGEGAPGLGRDVVEVQGAAAVAEEQLGRASVHLHPVHARVVRDRRVGYTRAQVPDPDRLQVNQVGHLLDDMLSLQRPRPLRLRGRSTGVGGVVRVASLGDADRDEVRGGVLRAQGSKDLVHAVLDQGELACSIVVK